VRRRIARLRTVRVARERAPVWQSTGVLKESGAVLQKTVLDVIEKKSWMERREKLGQCREWAGARSASQSKMGETWCPRRGRDGRAGTHPERADERRNQWPHRRSCLRISGCGGREKRKEQWFLEPDEEEGLVTARKRRDEHVPPGSFVQRLRSTPTLVPRFGLDLATHDITETSVGRAVVSMSSLSLLVTELQVRHSLVFIPLSLT
jgi:hypothetical protein